MRQVPTAAILSVALLSASTSSYSAESDNYVAWVVELRDSTDGMNSYVNAEVQLALAAVNRRSRRRSLSCEEVTNSVMSEIVGSRITVHVSRWAKHSDKIDRVYADYRAPEGAPVGIYGLVQWPYGVPKLSPTVKFNGVHMGTDKIGHIFLLGGDYYRKFMSLRRRGLDEPEAVNRMLSWGIVGENWSLGYALGGIFSYADLEANYQGFLMARSLCEGEDSYLERTATGWRQRRLIDLRDYVNPDYDETFNPSHFSAYRWDRIWPTIRKHYCPLRESPRVRDLFARYRAVFRKSVSALYLDAIESRGGLYDRSTQVLDRLCPN